MRKLVLPALTLWIRQLPLFQLFPESIGREAIPAQKESAEVIGAFETDIISYVRDGSFCMQNEILRLFQAALIDEIVGSYAECLFKITEEPEFRKVCRLCHNFQVYITIEVIFYEIFSIIESFKYLHPCAFLNSRNIVNFKSNLPVVFHQMPQDGNADILKPAVRGFVGGMLSQGLNYGSHELIGIIHHCQEVG